ncbi:MAG: response regulator [Chloroflexota bacterium]
MRILYVEDNQVNLMLVERVAKMGGHEVINRTSGEAALADFDEINPDLILMDIQLEGQMTGLDAVRELRTRGVEMPIVALTAYAMKGDREKALAAGCNQYLPKPLPINVLLDLLKKYEAATARREVLSSVTTQQSSQMKEKVAAAKAATEADAESAVPASTETPEKPVATGMPDDTQETEAISTSVADRTPEPAPAPTPTPGKVPDAEQKPMPETAPAASAASGKSTESVESTPAAGSKPAGESKDSSVQHGQTG